MISQNDMSGYRSVAAQGQSIQWTVTVLSCVLCLLMLRLVVCEPADAATPELKGTERMRVVCTSRLLHSIPELPGVPAYTGKVIFTGGRVAKDDAGLVVVELSAQEDILRIKQWYEDALAQNGWKLIPSRPSRGQIALLGQNHGTFIAICLYSCVNNKQYPTSITISMSSLKNN